MGVILVAYERESEQAALEQLLKGRGHQVLKASTGLAALELARREPPHAVVCDIVLPRMDGFALCRKWKQDERLQSVPFIFYTRRHDDPKYERFALELGAERFLARTTPLDTLAQAVDELLAHLPAVAAAPMEAEAPKSSARRGARTSQDAAASAAQAQALAKLQREHEQALARAQQQAAQAVANLKAEQEQALARAQRAHQRALDEVRQAHDRMSTRLEQMEATQQRIAAGEAHFRRVFEANPLPMWIADHATDGFIAVNDAALSLYGYGRAEFLALSRQALEGTPSDSEQEASVFTHRTKSGATLQVALGSRAIEFDGRSAQLVCAFDLTQRIRRERAKAEAAASAYTHIDALGDGFLALDAQARIVAANAAYCRMSGYSRERLLQMSLADLESSDGGNGATGFPPARVDGMARHARHQRADGSLFDVQVSVGSLGANGAPTTLLVREDGERRRQRQLESLVDLLQLSESFDETSIVRRVVEHAAILGESPLSYLYFVDPLHQTLTLAAWQDGGQVHVTMATAEARPLTQASCFSECLRARRPSTGNDPSRISRLEGLPDLQRYLAVPLLAEGQTVGILGVANRQATYGEDDRATLTALAEGAWRLVQTKRAHARTLSALQRADVALQGMIDSLVRMSERHDPYTAGSARRVAALAVALAREAGLDGRSQDAVRVAALLHDVGNIAVPAAVLAKPGALSPAELALMRMHVEEGCKLLADIDFGAPVAEIVFEHHERLDGSGYPRGIKGDDILIEARVLAIADAVEAMCSPRPYRAALGMDAALEQINQQAGKLYDLHLVTACTRLIRQRGFVLPE